MIAFLALDRNGNGVIDDGRELFGSATLGRNGTTAPNGFAALADLDDNIDGVVDSKDDSWKRLLLWVDKNHDGVSQPDELQPISSSPVTAIETSYHWTGRLDAYGNQFRYKGRAILNGTPTSIYDVWFATAR